MQGSVTSIVKYFFLYILIAFIAAPAIVYSFFYVTDSLILGNSTSADDVFNNVILDETSLSIGSILVIAIFIRKRYSNIDVASAKTADRRLYLWAFILELASILPINILVSSLNLGDNAMVAETDDAMSIVGILAICILAPISEELVFRGAVEEKLLQNKNKAVVAIVVSSLLFAIMHMAPSAVLVVFLSALLTGWVYYRTRNVFVCFLMHITNNGVSCLFDLFDAGTLHDILFQTQFLIAAVFGVAFMVAAVKNLQKITSPK